MTQATRNRLLFKAHIWTAIFILSCFAMLHNRPPKVVEQGQNFTQSHQIEEHYTPKTKHHEKTN